MSKVLDLAGMFKSDANDLIRARERAIRVHPTNIKAAGNEIEEKVRNYLRRILPPRYYVTSGHLIDPKHRVSPQLDVIISDSLNLPSLVKTKDGTEYIPITSALVIGEVKSTYYKSKQYYEEFHRKISAINGQMFRPLVHNTFYGGLNDGTIFQDIMLASPNKYINNLFSFLFCVSGGDFDFARLKPFINSTDANLLPNLTVLLDQGVVGYARMNEKGEFKYHKYPNEAEQSEHDWFFARAYDVEEGSPEGAHLALLYGQLINHLSTSRLEPANAYPYTSTMSVFRKSSLKWARDGS